MVRICSNRVKSIANTQFCRRSDNWHVWSLVIPAKNLHATCKLDCSNAASHIRTVHRMRNITVDPLHHRCLKSLHVIKATDDTYGCPNCSRKMHNFAENSLARQMHNSRCEEYKQTVRGLRDLLDKVTENAAFIVLGEVDTKFDIVSISRSGLSTLKISKQNFKRIKEVQVRIKEVQWSEKLCHHHNPLGSCTIGKIGSCTIGKIIDYLT